MFKFTAAKDQVDSRKKTDETDELSKIKQDYNSAILKNEQELAKQGIPFSPKDLLKCHNLSQNKALKNDKELFVVEDITEWNPPTYKK